MVSPVPGVLPTVPVNEESSVRDLQLTVIPAAIGVFALVDVKITSSEEVGTVAVDQIFVVLAFHVPAVPLRVIVAMSN